MTRHPRRFGIPLGIWVAGLSTAVSLSVMVGVIGAAIDSAKWLWLPAGVTVVFVYEFVAALRREGHAMAAEARNDELAAVIGGPLPDEIDWEQFEQRLQVWSEEGPR